MDLKKYIRAIPDFPAPGILFYDISTILGDAGAMRHTLSKLQAKIEGWNPDVIAGIESMGFLFTASFSGQNDAVEINTASYIDSVSNRLCKK